ncbi:MAG: RHS repeat-associated core domain-containing protein, partial [Pseudomonadota bacterium]
LNKETDPDTGWSYHGARWMAPQFARWLTPDPPVKAPDPKFMTAPWDLNPYQYVRQNPVMYWDPDGHNPSDTTIYVVEPTLTRLTDEGRNALTAAMRAEFDRVASTSQRAGLKESVKIEYLRGELTTKQIAALRPSDQVVFLVAGGDVAASRTNADPILKAQLKDDKAVARTHAAMDAVYDRQMAKEGGINIVNEHSSPISFVSVSFIETRSPLDERTVAEKGRLLGYLTLHEIGHGFGLKHSSGDDLMFPRIDYTDTSERHFSDADTTKLRRELEGRVAQR